jgi:hypothetical protein
MVASHAVGKPPLFAFHVVPLSDDHERPVPLPNRMLPEAIIEPMEFPAKGLPASVQFTPLFVDRKILSPIHAIRVVPITAREPTLGDGNPELADAQLVPPSVER